MRLFGGRNEKAAPGTGPLITLAQLRQRQARGEPLLLLDVRLTDAYRATAGVIPGALRIAPAELPERYQELPRDRTLVAY